MNPAIFGQGCLLGFTIAATVGPISLLVIRRTLAEGRIVGLASGLGVATADTTYGGIAAFGLTAITDVLVGGERILGLVGGCFLVWLAWRTTRASPGTGAAAVERRTGLAGAYLSILGLTLTNPLTILSFAALVAGLGISNRSPLDAGLMTLGVFAGSGTWWVVLTTGVAALRSRITPRLLRGVNVISGLVVGIFGIAAIVLAIRG
jgi:threonine/homoserine/homoserine lactone efflux protein